MKDNKVCVIVFTCDRPQELKRCLDSLRAQDYGEFGLLLVDNGTGKETVALARNFDARIISDRTKRLPYLFNLGWKNADAGLLVYLADDVELKGGWISEAVASIHRHPAAAVVTGPLISPYEFTGSMHSLYAQAQKSPLLRGAAGFYNKFVLEGKAFQPCVLCDSGAYSMGQGFKPDFSDEREVDLATTSCMLIRRPAIEAVGGFDEHFCFNHSDGDLFVRLKRCGYKIIYDPALEAIHYNKPGPSRYPFFIGRDTAYFYLKDIRPKSLKGFFAALTNILVLNFYWVYKAAEERSVKNLRGINGFFRGIADYILR